MQFTPGYNCSVRTMQGHGVHGMEIRWYLRGPAGGAQFALYTDWIPGELSPGHGLPPAGTSRSDWRESWLRFPMGADVGYHARRPQYEGHEPIHDNCPVIGGPCYYDGSGIRAEDLTKRFIVHGEAVIWAELEQEYQRLVDEESDAAAAANGSS